MHTPELPCYLTVELVYGDTITRKTLNGTDYTLHEEGRSVHCEVTSTIHVNKVVRLPCSWSEAYIAQSPRRMRGEVLNHVINRYGLKPEPIRYS